MMVVLCVLLLVAVIALYGMTTRWWRDDQSQLSLRWYGDANSAISAVFSAYSSTPRPALSDLASFLSREFQTNLRVRNGTITERQTIHKFDYVQIGDVWINADEWAGTSSSPNAIIAFSSSSPSMNEVLVVHADGTIDHEFK